MFLGCSGTTSLGGKWLFFISLRCDGVLGPRGVSVTVLGRVGGAPGRRHRVSPVTRPPGCISLVMGPLDYSKGRHTSKLFLLGLNLCAVIWGLPTCTPLRWTQITKQDVFKDLLVPRISAVEDQPAAWLADCA